MGLLRMGCIDVAMSVVGCMAWRSSEEGGGGGKSKLHFVCGNQAHSVEYRLCTCTYLYNCNSGT